MPVSTRSVVRQETLTEKEPTEAGSAESRRYMYCIIDSDGPRSFGSIGIGKDSPEVRTVVYNGVAAVVSPSSLEKYPIDRQNTLAHQRVMEHVMGQGGTVLPVKFDTIADARNGSKPEERIVRQVLETRYDELQSLLAVMSTRVELGVKALWRDKNTIFWEIVNSSDTIRRLRSKIAGPPATTAQGGTQFGIRVKLGERVKNALEAMKAKERAKLLNALKPLVVDYRENKTFGDQMFANLALLVEKSRVEELDDKLDELADAAAGRTQFKYVGPVPPSNFVEIVITWED